MAEREEDRSPADGTERPDGTEPDGEPTPARDGGEPGLESGPGHPALDEDAAWAELIASFDAEPSPGAGPWPDAENLSADAEDSEDAGPGQKPGPASVAPLGAASGLVVHPVIQGPRDYELEDDEDEGHFVPPEPPPLPEADVTTKFAWLAVLGGPLLVLVFILLQQELVWWVVTVGVGGFLGGFATLVARMRPGGEEDDDLPGGGAVV